MKCQDDTDRKHGSVKVDTRIKGNAGRCQVGRSSPSKHIVSLKNYKKHPIYVKIEIKADNSRVKYRRSNSSSVTHIKRLPKYNSQKRRKPKSRSEVFELQKSASGSDEILKVTVKYSNSSSMTSPNSTVPDTEPIIDLV